MPDRLAEAREQYDLALVELGDFPPADGDDWPIGAWVRAQWHLMRAQALEGLARLAPPLCGSAPGTLLCPAHGPHPHNGMVCLDCPQCATRATATRDV